MADFGQLTARQDDYDISFTLGRKTYKIKPSVEQVLDYMAAWNRLESNTERHRIQGVDVWEITAPLLGARFDRDSYRFVPGPEGEENRNLVPELLSKGVDLETLGNLLAAVHAKYQHGDEVATLFYETGDLGKAFTTVLNKQKAEAEAAEKETPQDTGETAEDV